MTHTFEFAVLVLDLEGARPSVEDDCYVTPSEHCIDQRFCRQLCIFAGTKRKTRQSPPRGLLEHPQAGGREGRGEAQEQQERGGESVESPFEVCERHDTHTFQLNPQGSEGVLI